MQAGSPNLYTIPNEADAGEPSSPVPGTDNLWFDLKDGGAIGPAPIHIFPSMVLFINLRIKAEGLPIPA